MATATGRAGLLLPATSTLASVELVRATGPRTVLVTSVERPDREDGTIEMLAVDDSGTWLVQTPYIPMKANGSGDVTAALFTAHYRRTGDLADAVARTTSSVFDLLSRTHESASASCGWSNQRTRTPTRGCSSRHTASADSNVPSA